MRILLDIAKHDRQLSRKKPVRIGQRQQKRLHRQPFRCGFRLVRRDRGQVDAALPRKHVDQMRVVPRAGRHGGKGQVAVDQYSCRALQAAMHKRHHQPLPAQRDPLVRFVDEKVLERGRELARERQRRLRGLQRLSGQRVRSAHELFFEHGPERCRRRPVLFGKFEAFAVAHRDPVGGRKGVADHMRRVGRVAPQRLVQPQSDLGGADFGWIGRTGIDRRQRELQGHGSRMEFLFVSVRMSQGGSRLYAKARVKDRSIRRIQAGSMPHRHLQPEYPRFSLAGAGNRRPDRIALGRATSAHGLCPGIR